MACIVFTFTTPSFFHNLIACTLCPLLSWLLALIPWIFPCLWESWWCRQWRKSVMCSRWLCYSPKESFWPWQYPLLKIPPRVIGFNHLGKIFLVTILNMQKRSSYIGESITLNYNLWQLLTLFFLVFLPLYICRPIKPKLFLKKKTSFNPAQKCCKAHKNTNSSPDPYWTISIATKSVQRDMCFWTFTGNSIIWFPSVLFLRLLICFGP